MQPVTSRIKRNLGKKSDGDLLVAVGLQRDHQAFHEFASRYEKSAFNLAQHICRDRDEAFEVTQEAMLALWTSARNFDPAGNPKGWFLRIVARLALKFRHGKLKRRSRNEDIAKVSSGGVMQALDGDAETREALLYLRTQLDDLVEEQRLILALYFGGQLTQLEIGQSLSLSQRTVSEKIKNTLKELKVRLAGAGFSAVDLIFEPAMFASVFMQGSEVPAYFKKELLTRMASQSDANGMVLSASTAVKTFAPFIVVFLVVATAAGAACTYAQMSSPGAEPIDQTTRTEAGRTEKNVGYQPLHRIWDFAKSSKAAKDFRFFEGRWDWERNSVSKEGQMRVGTSKAIFLLPVLLPKQPMEIIITFQDSEIRLGGLGGFLRTEEGVLEYLRWDGAFSGPNAVFENRIYITDPYMVSLVDGRINRVAKYMKPYAGELYGLVVINLAVKKIELRSLDKDHYEKILLTLRPKIKRFIGSAKVRKTRHLEGLKRPRS